MQSLLRSLSFAALLVLTIAFIERAIKRNPNSPFKATKAAKN